MGVERLAECHLGIEDKAAVLQAIAARRGLPLEALAYLGDDFNDLEAMTLAGLSACPGDAFAEVRGPHRVRRPRRPRGVPGARGDPHRGRNAAARLIRRGVSRDGLS
ncbi:MAG: HAD hydrolase family protein [Gammaproteobacteria bacterium]